MVKFIKYLYLLYILSFLKLSFSVVEISWDFSDNDNEGWISESSQNLEVYAKNGELRCSITGEHPKLDSPSILVYLTSRHYLIIRLQYEIRSSKARILLLSYNSPDGLIYGHHKILSEPVNSIQASSSLITFHNYSISNLCDGDDTTYMLGTFSSAGGITIKFDLLTYRWISSFFILPVAGVDAPRHCLLQKSMTSSTGPYTTITSFTASNAISDTKSTNIYGLNEYGRYWQLVILDNYGGVNIGIRDIKFEGYLETVTILPFTTTNSNHYEIYYLPLSTVMLGPLVLMQLQLNQPLITPGAFARVDFAIDYVRIGLAPEIWRVNGCLDQYYADLNRFFPNYLIQNSVTSVNGNLNVYSYSQYIPLDNEGDPSGYKYSSTIDCPLTGNIEITVHGIDFGNNPDIFVNGSKCEYLSQIFTTPGGRESTVRCKLLESISGGFSLLRIQDSIHPGLFYESDRLLSYRIPPPQPMPPHVINIRARALDLCWSPPVGPINDPFYGSLITTAYIIMWYPLISPIKISNMTVGNITCTTVRGLSSNTDYSFAISAVAEGGAVEMAANLPIDLYGRRDLLPYAEISDPSLWTNATRTSLFDIQYKPSCTNSSNYQESILNSSIYELNEMALFNFTLMGTAEIISTPCNSSRPFLTSNVLRLTSSSSQQAGAAWYPKLVNVNEGFDTEFDYIISSPSVTCDRMDDVNTFCRSRGADGLAFVIQNDNPNAIGTCGSGLGYEGISNGLSIEIDTYMNYDKLDVYENHVAVLTQGWRVPLSSNHSYALASTSGVPDLTDRSQRVRIKYDPVFDISAVHHPSFITTEYTTQFLINADFVNGGQGDWGDGMGLLYIYVNDLDNPVITTPLNLGSTLHLNRGSAYVGFTAGTGDTHWQTHDIINWNFTSLTRDIPYTSPFIVNGQGAYDCVNLESCVHYPDLQHYMRQNNVPITNNP